MSNEARVEDLVGPTCIPNIGPLERRKRLRIGTGMLAAAALGGAALAISSAGRGWRVLMFAPFLGGAIGVLQVREKTCVKLAKQGLRNMDAGDEVITDATELQRVRSQASVVYLKSVLLAAGLTALLLALPRP